MATSRFSATVSRSTGRRCSTNFHPLPTTTTFLPAPPKYKTNSFLRLRTTEQVKWAVRVRSVAQEQLPPKPTTFDAQQLVDFLYQDLPHLFDDQGIDPTVYDEQVKFRDPITKHDTITGYLFNIAMLRKLFNPDFQLHWVKQVRLLPSLFGERENWVLLYFI